MAILDNISHDLESKHLYSKYFRQHQAVEYNATRENAKKFQTDTLASKWIGFMHRRAAEEWVAVSQLPRVSAGKSARRDDDDDDDDDDNHTPASKFAIAKANFQMTWEHLLKLGKVDKHGQWKRGTPLQ